MFLQPRRVTSCGGADTPVVCVRCIDYMAFKANQYGNKWVTPVLTVLEAAAAQTFQRVHYAWEVLPHGGQLQ